MLSYLNLSLLMFPSFTAAFHGHETFCFFFQITNSCVSQNAIFHDPIVQRLCVLKGSVDYKIYGISSTVPPQKNILL